MTQFFVTTPIYYPNAEPHIGHTYTTIVADVLMRWHAQRGFATWSVSGVDQHGEKMVETAAQRGVPVRQLVEHYAKVFQDTWAALGISPSRFVCTTEPVHVANVQRILKQVHDAGWIEKREYEGRYCVGCERFLTERDLVDGKCRDHEREPELRRETNYFFLMSREFAWLRGEIESGRFEIRPERYRNEALAMLRDESGLGDLSISRPKTRLDWGIELPFDRAHVCYVWFDALISYLTGAGLPDDPRLAARWAVAEHLIAKDILKPHAIFWPIMLKAMGYTTPRRLSVHGYWNVDDRKVSKSLGNMISPLAMRDRYGFEPFRYYLLREMSYGLDSSFSEAAMVERVNADLANNLGNLVSRTLNLVEKVCGGAYPDAGELDPNVLGFLSLDQSLRQTREQVERAFGQLQAHAALAAIFQLSTDLNRLIDGFAPWKLAKEPGGVATAGAVLRVACDGLRAIADLLVPFLPDTAARIAAKLDARPLVRGEPLFPRLELAAD